jgi:hypothetical protein
VDEEGCCLMSILSVSCVGNEFLCYLPGDSSCLFLACLVSAIY